MIFDVRPSLNGSGQIEFRQRENQSNCVGFAAYSLGLLSQERLLMPQEYTTLFKDFRKTKISAPILRAPEDVKAIVVSQNNKEGPFFPLHAAVIDPDDRTKIRHRPGLNTEIEVVEIDSFISSEIAKGRELFFISE